MKRYILDLRKQQTGVRPLSYRKGQCDSVTDHFSSSLHIDVMQAESNYDSGDGCCNALYSRVGLGAEGTLDNNSNWILSQVGKKSNLSLIYC
jgi:hypothetical protein